MNHVLQGVAIEDSIQLVDSVNAPVDTVLFSEVLVTIRKEGDAGFSSKTVLAGDWLDRSITTPGMYTLKFSGVELDTLGVFRYRIDPVTPGHFKAYEDILHVVATYPTFPEQDPPNLNLQTASPAGVTPDPVAHNSTLTLNGTNLENATTVFVGGISLGITSNTSAQIQATVTSSVPLGTQVVQVDTPGGRVTTEVGVVIDAASIPGSGFVNLTGQIWSNKTGEPAPAGTPVRGRVLDMPNLAMGVGWSDELRTVVTNSNGEFTLPMPVDVRVRVDIPYIRYARVFTTPNAVSANLFSEIPNT